MQCRSCGTDIADKALICYRCGTATVEAKHKPYETPPASSRAPLVLGATIALVLLALVLYFLLYSTP